MSDRPAFQFYVKDWRSNSKLRRCSAAARGVWIDVLCALHDSDEYGVARYSLAELAREVGASMAHLRELVDKGVLKGSDTQLEEGLVYRPRSGRREGAPVALLEPQAGPIWFSSRMVKDEYIRGNRGASTRFGAELGERKDDSPGRAPAPSPTPRQGDGLPSASASAIRTYGEKEERSARAPDSAPPPGPPDPPPPEVGSFSPTPAGAACKAMRVAGLQGTNPSDPRLLALLEAGATPEEFAAVAAEAKAGGKTWAWVLTVVQRRRQEAAEIRSGTPGRAEPEAWDATAAGIKAKGAELGLPWSEDGWVNGEHYAFPAYSAMVRRKAKGDDRRAA